jgi:NitT/TauT family transport system permease protein
MALPFGALVRPRASAIGRSLAAPGPLILGTCSLIAGLVIWQVLSRWVLPSSLFPTPGDTIKAMTTQLVSGLLIRDVVASMTRLLAGWLLGTLCGVALGLAIGFFKPAKYYFEPAIQFMRFIPAIALITPFTVWWGVGEMSKVMLILYASTFVVMLNTMIGVTAIPRARIRAARCFQASPLKIFLHVTLPSTLPFILTGARIGMGNAFMIVVAAEMLGSENGLGFLIFTSRSYLATDMIFVGIFTLGILGLSCDFIFQRAALGLFRRWGYR